MRTTSNPNVTHPDDLYTRDELARMHQAADLEEQIKAIDLRLMELDDRMNGADNAGDTRQLSALESQCEELIDLQMHLQKELRGLFD